MLFTFSIRPFALTELHLAMVGVCLALSKHNSTVRVSIVVNTRKLSHIAWKSASMVMNLVRYAAYSIRMSTIFLYVLLKLAELVRLLAGTSVPQTALSAVTV